MPQQPWPASATTRGLLVIVLLWNSVAGFFAARRLPLPGDEATFAAFGVIAPSAPTALAGLWLTTCGLLGVWLARRHDPRWHVVAALFYGVQVLALLRPVRISFWTGLFIGVPLPIGSGPGLSVVINLCSLLLCAVHLRGAAASDLVVAQGRSGLRVLGAGVLGMTSMLRVFWGVRPLTRSALARRLSSIASIGALAVPACASLAMQMTGSPRQVVGMWLGLVVLPSFLVAYLLAGPRHADEQARFSAGRGATAALAALTGAVICTWVLGRADVREHGALSVLLTVALFGSPLLAWMYCLGAVSGLWLARRAAALDPIEGFEATIPNADLEAAGGGTRDAARRRPLEFGEWLTLTVIVVLCAVPILKGLYILGAFLRGLLGGQ